VGAALEIGALAALVAAALLLLAALLQRRGAARASGGHGPDATPARAAEAEAQARAADDRARAALQDAALLAELVGVGVARIAPDLTVTAANEAAHRLLDRRAGAMPGKSALEAFTDHRVEEIALTAFETGSAVGELTVRTSEAPTILVRARRTPSGDAWLVLEDVSELRRLQRIRAEFIDNLGHELRTPLTTVSILAETLAADAASLPPKAAERVAKIEVETGHLVQMVNELLDLARIESGTAGLVVEDLDLARLAETTTDRLRLFAERQGVTLVVEAPPGVPLVRGDAERLGQALLNLLHNAVKFSSAGSVVTVRVTPAESQVVVAVEDHGQGIPRLDLPRIFERFYKVDRARARIAGGTGLGLSIARHIVEAHGGRIWAESEEGTGSTFSFAIPVTGPDLRATPGG
jgi:two-component system phosphate regulon sensor histidine kinase PhoR